MSNGSWRPAQNGRQETSWEFPYNADWNGTHDDTGRVRPVFVEEVVEIVFTVYPYFFGRSRAMRIRHDAAVDALSSVFRDTTVSTRDPSTFQQVVLEGVGALAPTS